MTVWAGLTVLCIFDISLVPPHLKMHVQGKGAMSDMYKAMISMFDPVSESKVKLDTAPCLPDPNEPNWKIYDEIGEYISQKIYFKIL